MRKAFLLKGMVDINALRGFTDPFFPPLGLKKAMELKEAMILLVILKSITWGFSQLRAKLA